MPTRLEINRLLTQGVAAAKAGQRAQAYRLLLEVVELDPRNELAWVWLSSVTDDVEDQRICLENALTINPQNKLAYERLVALPVDGRQASHTPPATVICPQCGAGNRDFVRECSACGYAFFARCPACGTFNLTEALACSQCGSTLTPGAVSSSHAAHQPNGATTSDPVPSSLPTPITLWPVVAFWMSLSILFIAGGVASLLQFFNILLRARGILQSLSFIQIAWLPVALFFLVFGFTGLSLVWQLARRRPGGYYGSLVFGLLLSLLGPSAGLILEPPDYRAVVCTGLMPAAAVVFTIASMAGFEFYTNDL